MMSEATFSFYDDQIRFSHASYDTMPPTGFHLHNGCEIYLLISGDIKYFIEGKTYSVTLGDLIITNSDELHMVSFLSNRHYERYFIVFDPVCAAGFSTIETELTKCFLNRKKGEDNIVTIDAPLLENILDLLKRMEFLGSVRPFGFDVLLRACFMELLVMINDAFHSSSKKLLYQPLPTRLTSILNYIHTHLADDLSLDALAQKFYINKHYLRKLFKTATGFSLHEYILYRRIANAKIALKNGLSVTETAENCGFLDYCSFIRTFKRIVGSSPGKYKKGQQFI